YDKIARDVREKEESLAKARLDLNAELQAAGGVSIAAAPSPRTPLPPPSPGDVRGVSTPAPLSPGDSVSGRGGPGSVRRDGPWVLESLGLGQQHGGARVRALEVKLAAQIEERDAAKQARNTFSHFPCGRGDAIQAMEKGLKGLRLMVKDVTLRSFSEDTSRHSSLSEILHSMLSALVETAKLLAAEHTRADESKKTHLIDGRKDVKELVDRNAHRVQAPAGHAPRSRGGGHGDAVMFMAYHSEVLQRERDLLRKSHLSPAAGLGKELQGLEGETVGLRRAGGGGHPLFTAMAEAALAQVGLDRRR
ncbi:unnamed protein product, partial [Laminaria digitata]